MRAKRGRAAAVLVAAVAAFTVPSATGVGPLAYAQATAKASVVNHDATLRGDGTVPVKVHCAAAEGRRCKGNLRLVVKFNGTNIPNTRQAFAVRGQKSKTFHLQATGRQLELFLQAGTRDAIVKVKEKKPHPLPVHSAIVTVHVPS
jgi:hypothetical protein